MCAQFMGRDSRKIIDLLGSICSQKGVGQLVTPMDIYSADILTYRFFTPPILNLLKTRTHGVRKFESKHGSAEYWLPVIVNMLKSSGSAQRPEWRSIDSDATRQCSDILWTITSNYLIADYGYSDLTLLMNIVHTYTMEEILYAIGVGKGNRVYEVRYINAVLEKERAKKRIIEERRDAIHTKAQSSDRLLGETIHQHSILDMAQVQHNWEQTQENMRIQREFEAMIKGTRGEMKPLEKI